MYFHVCQEHSVGYFHLNYENARFRYYMQAKGYKIIPVLAFIVKINDFWPNFIKNLNQLNAYAIKNLPLIYYVNEK